MVKGEGKHTRLSHLNRNRNKSMRHEDMRLILLIAENNKRAMKRREDTQFVRSIPEETCKIQRTGGMAYYSHLLFFLVMAQD